MISLAETLIIVAILLLNFATLIWLKNTIFLTFQTILTSLAIILFCVINISDFEILQNIIIAMIIFSGAILALFLGKNSDDGTHIFKNKLHLGLSFLVILAISSGIFYLSLQIKNQPAPENEMKLEEIMQIVGSVGVVEGKLQNSNLKNNVILKNSTDAILIICGLMMVILLTGKHHRHR
jgi:uncharacterized membrane protein